MIIITTPVNLTQYEILTNNVTKSDVENSLRGIMTWLKNNQAGYYQNNLTEFTDKVLEEELRFTGSLNSLGRKLGIAPNIPASYQPYNLAEMFRTTILMKAVGYIQNQALYNIIGEFNSEPTVKDVLTEFKLNYPFLKTPKLNYTQRTITTLFKTGVIQNIPTADGILPFWATDTHYSKVTRDKRKVFFTFKIAGKGSITLKFILPNRERFIKGKLTRPTVFLGKKGELRFGFTLQTTVDSPKITQNTLGVDLGRVEPFVGTLINDKTYSQPLFTNKQVNLLTHKITKLQSLSQKLWVKEEINHLKNHDNKYEILKNERLKIRSKISRLKLERAHRVGTQIINVAQSHNATILLENLAWVPQSKWEQSIQQTIITDRATRSSIPVRKINPKNTSQICPRCENKITHSARSTNCFSCKRKLNRDILASRNIARSLSKVSFQDLKQIYTKAILPNNTRCSEPVTTGAIQPNYAINTT